ncbi:MAG TPA: ATP synthase F1 subunit epsilon [Candidatus Peribacteraceae bacterium]|nr:ATP synthase F1 subunit epsilon [Candidatus Peribacteraceae bacterium]
MYLEILTPDDTMYRGSAESVTMPTGDGEITVLTGHIPLISTLVPGTVIVREKNEESLFAVTRGVVQVDGMSVRVLADTADRTEGLEEAAIQAAKERAEQILKEKRTDEEGFADARAILERELAKLQTVRRLRSRRRSS